MYQGFYRQDISLWFSTVNPIGQTVLLGPYYYKGRYQKGNIVITDSAGLQIGLRDTFWIDTKTIKDFEQDSGETVMDDMTGEPLNAAISDMKIAPGHVTDNSLARTITNIDSVADLDGYFTIWRITTA